MSFIPSTDFLIEVAKGNVPGHSLVAKFGRNPSIDTADGFADIWTVPIVNKTWLTTAVNLEAISTSANDIAAGSGAQIITVQGLNDSFLGIEEDITMNGTSASTATTNLFIRVNRMFTKQVGTYRGSNEGDISVRISGGGVVQSNILTGKGQTEQSHFSIAADEFGILLQAYISVDTNKTATGELYQIPGADDITTPFVGAFRK
jgi:hypothetical protein